MYVRTDIIDGCAVSRLVRLEPGESPPVWDGEDWGAEQDSSLASW